MKRIIGILAGAALFILTVTPSAQAKAAVTVTEKASFTTLADSVLHNTITLLPNGTKVVTWRDSKQGQPTRFQASYILPDGTQGNTWTLFSSAYVVNQGWDPAIYVEHSGRTTMAFAVTEYTSWVQNPEYVTDLYVTQTTDGITWTTPRPINQASFPSCVSENLCGDIRPQLAMTSVGTMVVAWGQAINSDYIKVLTGNSNDGLNWGAGTEVGRTGLSWSDLAGQSVMQLKTSGMAAMVVYVSGAPGGPDTLMSSYSTDIDTRFWSTPAPIGGDRVQLVDVSLAGWGNKNFYAMWKEGSNYMKIGGASFDAVTRTWGAATEIESCQVIPTHCRFLELKPENVFSNGTVVTAAWQYRTWVGNNSLTNDEIHAVTINSGVPGRPVIVSDGEWGSAGINQELDLISSGASPNNGWYFWLISRTYGGKIWLGQGASVASSNATLLSSLAVTGNTSIAQEPSGDLWVSIAERTNFGFAIKVYLVHRASAPTLSGKFTLAANPKVGKVVNAPAGNWYSPGKLTTKYQWYTCSKAVTKVAASVPPTCTMVKGAIQAKFTPSKALAKKLLTVLVTQTNSAGTTKALTPTVTITN